MLSFFTKCFYADRTMGALKKVTGYHGDKLNTCSGPKAWLPSNDCAECFWYFLFYIIIINPLLDFAKCSSIATSCTQATVYIHYVNCYINVTIASLWQEQKALSLEHTLLCLEKINQKKSQFIAIIDPGWVLSSTLSKLMYKF